jgi:signal transduction histidine kinase
MTFTSNLKIDKHIHPKLLNALPDIFGRILPFYIVLDRNLNIIHLGPVLRRLYPQILEHSPFTKHFQIERPAIELNFNTICDNPKSLFVIKSRHNGMAIKGQIEYVEYVDSILFVGSPWISDVTELNRFELKLSDFAIHESISDFLFLIQAQNNSIVDMNKLTTKLTVQKEELRNSLIKEKQLKTELSKALNQEKELNELKSRFITTASHEFRTPLGIISSSAGLLEEYDNKLDAAKRLKHLQRIQSSVRHMTRLLEDILLINQAEMGKMKFNPAPIDLANFCRELVEEVEIGMNAQDRFTLSFPQQLDNAQSIYMDEKLLRQILSNLLSNAIKYSYPDTKVDFNFTLANSRAIFAITDRGIGISEEDQIKLFESFHRGDNAGNIQGTGLGLSIVKRCAQLHQGDVSVTSQLNVGTTFTVNLPLNPLA